MTYTKFIGNFVYGKEAGPPATDEQMIQVFGDDWINIPWGDMRDKLNELLSPFGWTYDLNESTRSKETVKGTMIVESSLRHSTAFFLRQNQ